MVKMRAMDKMYDEMKKKTFSEFWFATLRAMMLQLKEEYQAKKSQDTKVDAIGEEVKMPCEDIPAKGTDVKKTTSYDDFETDGQEVIASIQCNGLTSKCFVLGNKEQIEDDGIANVVKYDNSIYDTTRLISEGINYLETRRDLKY